MCDYLLLLLLTRSKFICFVYGRTDVWCTIGMSPLNPFVHSFNGELRWNEHSYRRALASVEWHLQMNGSGRFCRLNYSILFVHTHAGADIRTFVFVVARPLLKWHRVELWRTATIAFCLIDHSTRTCYWLDTHTVVHKPIDCCRRRCRCRAFFKRVCAVRN